VKRATSTVPVVFVAVSDPVGSGLVDSLSRPGGNITVLTHISKEVQEERAQLLKELALRVSRIAVLAGPSWRLTLADTQAAAQALGLQVDVVEVRAPDELEEAFSRAGRGSAQALVVLPDALFFAQRQRIGQLAATNRLPTVFELKSTFLSRASCPAERTLASRSAAPRSTSIAFSKAPNPPISPSSNPRGSSW
jgi:putative ABC transport system substrate-binding protein